MTAEPLTIGELIAIDTLQTEVIAGASGLGRRVLWAHSCELKEPWQWLGPDELLMTIGFCVPRDAGGQVEFIQKLDEAGIVGVMLGERDEQLKLSEEMLAEAERRSFPVMRTQHQVPWSAVARHIAAASSVSQTSQVLVLAKLYELAASAGEPQSLANNIAGMLNIGFKVVEVQTGIELLESRFNAASEVAESRRRVHRLQSRHAATLEIIELPGMVLSAMVLVHLKRILEVETDRVLFQVELIRESWDRMLKALLMENDSREIKKYLDLPDLQHGCRVILIPEDELTRASKAVSVKGLVVVVGLSGSSGLIIAPNAEVRRVQNLLANLDVRAGVSSIFDGWAEIRGAIAEAISAFEDAAASDKLWAEFEGIRVAILSRSEREARLIIREVLGPLAEDNDKMAVLRETLFAYLRNDRSWAQSAAELGIHRQTLSYRLRRAEVLTGRTVAKTEDLAALWIAAQAWNKFGGNPKLET